MLDRAGCVCRVNAPGFLIVLLSMGLSLGFSGCSGEPASPPAGDNPFAGSQNSPAPGIAAHKTHPSKHDHAVTQDAAHPAPAQPRPQPNAATPAPTRPKGNRTVAQ